MFHIAYTIMLVTIAVALYQTATLVIGGHILKDTLAPFYSSLPEWWQRMLIVIIPLSGVGNLLATQAFQKPVIAGVTFLVVGLWAPLIAANIIRNTNYTITDLLIIGAISILGLILGVRIA